MAADTEMVLLGLVEKAKRDELLTAQTLPKTTNSDNGKVLKVSGGKWALPAGLPSVSPEDNGKVLMVVNGEWTIADLPSGGK